MRILLSLSLSISLCLGLAAAGAAEPGRGQPAQAVRPCGPERLLSPPPALPSPAADCGGCHTEQSRWVSRSLMASLSGIINQTRYLWGAQPDAGPRYAATADAGLPLTPTFQESGALVDDLLRRRCLRCHLGAGGQDEAAAGAACAACHILSGSETMAPNQKLPGPEDKPRSPWVTTAIPSSQCLHCHQGNRVGADYAGLFERDHATSYNFEAQDPETVPQRYSHAYHFLLPDIHYERGLHCIDCHPVEEVMGAGAIHAQSQDQVGIRCTDCHGLPGKPPRSRLVTAADQRALRAARANPNYQLAVGQRVLVTSREHLLTNTRAEPGKFLLVSKVDGRTHQIPVLSRESPQTGPLDHRLPGHLNRLECAACHAAWTFQDMGLHLVRLEAADYDPWVWLTQQGDPQVNRVLQTELVKPPSQRNLPASFDYLSGRSDTGLWLAGYSLRRWEGIVLGLDARGLVSPLRPQFQYWVSRVDSAGRALLDSVIPTTAAGQRALAWNPYAPHTIRRRTRACWDCHGNPRALGLGQPVIWEKEARPVPLTRPAADGLGLECELDQLIDAQGRPLQTSSRPGAAFFDQERLKKMSAANPLYVKYLLEYYAGKEAYGEARGFSGPKK